MNWNNEPETSKFGNEMIPAKKQLIVFLIGWVGFQLFAVFAGVIISLISSSAGIDTSTNIFQLRYAMIVNTISYLAFLVAIVLVVNTDIVKLFKSFKQYQSYIAGAVCLFAVFAFTILYNLFLSTLKITTTDNANQSSLVTMDKMYPIASFIVFGIIGPICEEFAYRVGLFSLLRRKSKVLGYVLTIIIFAFIHFNFSLNVNTLINELLNLPFYMFAALAFSYTYEKYGLAGSLSAHIANNVLSLSLVSIIH